MRTKHQIQKRPWIGAALLWLGVLACGRLSAATYLSEDFAYPDGPITAPAASFWEHTSGKERELNVKNGALLLREDHSEDVAANLASGPFAADSGATLYAAFDLTATAFPSGEGNYFAHFRDSGSNFRGRVFIAPAADGESEFCQLGISSGGKSSEETTFFPQPLAIGTRYQVAVGYEVGTASSTLWVNPTNITSESVSNADSASSKTITRFAFRQSLISGDGMGNLQIDNLAVSSTLEEALAGPSSQPPPEPEPEPEPVAVIRIVAESQTIQEGDEALSLTCTRTERTDEEARIALTWTGTAQAGSDFAAPPDGIVMESGEESVSLSVPLLNDEEIEPDEVLEVSFSAESSLYKLEPERIVWTIQDDDRQGLLIQERFSGPDAPLISLPGWATHSGQPEQTQTAGGSLRLNDKSTEDVHLEIPGQPFFADEETELFAAFDLVLRAMASGSGTYFAHFKGQSKTAFRGRLYLRPVEDDEEKFQLGVLPGSSGNPSYATTLLALRQNYRVALGYHLESGRTRLWLNPSEETSTPDAESQETASAVDITSFAFRQTGQASGGIGELAIDNLAVGANLESVLTSPPSPPEPPEPPLPSISIETLQALAFEEGQRNGEWRILRDGDPSETLEVSLMLSGSAVLSEDFALPFSQRKFVFASGESSRVLTLSPVDDDAVEGVETVEISLLPGNGYEAGCPTLAVIDIVDNDAPALNQPVLLAVDRETLTASVPSGSVFRLQKSVDLRQWETVETIEGNDDPFVFPLENFQENTLFFRLMEGVDRMAASVSCVEDNRILNVGFYALFSPISHSESPEDPACSGFDKHLGYEADLLTALEALDGAGLSFSRKAIPDWDGIWLRSATPEYDLIGGGITILESRMLDASGKPIVAFTSGHVAFRQSLLARAADAAKLADYDSLTSDIRVGVLRGTTGEFRLLQLTGLVNDEGALASGSRVETSAGEVMADGSPAYQITAAQATDNLIGRLRLFPPSETMPQVIYLGSETELLQALGDGQIDALARGEIGNQDAAHLSEGAFVVTAIDLQAKERGGFALAVEDTALLACLNEKIDWLTRNGEIGYAEWRKDPKVFLNRAALWNRLRAAAL